MSATPACVTHDRSLAPRPRRCRARRPENTPLYHAVQHHFESWLALKRAGEPWEDTVPAFVVSFRQGYVSVSHPGKLGDREG